MSNINQKQQVSSKKAVTIISVLLGLLLSINIYNYFFGGTMPGSETQKVISEKDMTLQQLQQQFDINKRALDSLQIVFPEQQQELQMLKGELEQKRAQLEREINNGKNLIEAQKEISQLRNQRDEFAAKIAKLEDKIVYQEQQVTQYRAQYEQANAKLVEVSQQYDEAQVREVASEKQKAEEQARRVKQKREEEERKSYDARLSVENIIIKVMEVGGRNNDKEREAKKAKNVERFKISFTHGNHSFIKEGTTQFKIKITDGLGLTVGEMGADVDKESNTPFKYTTVAEVNYTGSGGNVSAIWNVPSDLKLTKGTYTIEVYHNGWKAGNGSITLK